MEKPKYFYDITIFTKGEVFHLPYHVSAPSARDALSDASALLGGFEWMACLDVFGTESIVKVTKISSMKAVLSKTVDQPKTGD